MLVAAGGGISCPHHLFDELPKPVPGLAGLPPLDDANGEHFGAGAQVDFGAGVAWVRWPATRPEPSAAATITMTSAAAVIVNGMAATLDGLAFAATVTLPNAGANRIVLGRNRSPAPSESFHVPVPVWGVRCAPSIALRATASSRLVGKA